MIEKIEGFEPELEVDSVGDLGILQRTKIERHKFRSAQDASPGVPKDLGVRGERERGYVPELVALLRAVVRVDAAYGIAVIRLAAHDVDCCIVDHDAGPRCTGADDTDTADLPARYELGGEAGQTTRKCFSFAKGKFIQGAVHQVVLSVENRWTIVESPVPQVGRGQCQPSIRASVTVRGCRVERLRVRVGSEETEAMREAFFRLHLESAVIRGNGILKYTRFQSQHLVRGGQIGDRLNHLAAVTITGHERHLPVEVLLVLQVR